MSITAMKQALDALENHTAIKHPQQRFYRDAAIDALRAAIEQAEKPVAWIWKDGTITADPDRADGTWTPLYTAPPQRQWIGLTADEIWQCNKAPAGHRVEYHICVAHQNVLDFAEAIEAKIKEKHT